MHVVSEVLHEVLRLQVLVFVSRPSRQHSSAPLTLEALTEQLRIPMNQCIDILHELQDDGMLEVLLAGPFPVRAPVQLTPVGEGWVQWMHQQSQKQR